MQVDIRERLSERLASAQSGPVQQQDQGSEGIGVQLPRTCTGDIHRLEKTLDLLPGADVGRQGCGRLRFALPPRRRGSVRYVTGDGKGVPSGQTRVPLHTVVGQPPFERQST